MPNSGVPLYFHIYGIFLMTICDESRLHSADSPVASNLKYLEDDLVTR